MAQKWPKVSVQAMSCRWRRAASWRLLLPSPSEATKLPRGESPVGGPAEVGCRLNWLRSFTKQPTWTSPSSRLTWWSLPLLSEYCSTGIKGGLRMRSNPGIELTFLASRVTQSIQMLGGIAPHALRQQGMPNGNNPKSPRIGSNSFSSSSNFRARSTLSHPLVSNSEASLFASPRHFE